MRVSLSALVTVVFLALGCGDSEPSGPEPEPQLPNGVFAAITDGAEYEPNIATISVVDNHLSVTTSDGVQGFTFTLDGTLPGVYMIGPEVTHMATFTGAGGATWQALQSNGSGQINININTGERLSGNFDLILAPVPGTGAVGNKRVESGIINLRY